MNSVVLSAVIAGLCLLPACSLKPMTPSRAESLCVFGPLRGDNRADGFCLDARQICVAYMESAIAVQGREECISACREVYRRHYPQYVADHCRFTVHRGRDVCERVCRDKTASGAAADE